MGTRLACTANGWGYRTGVLDYRGQGSLLRTHQLPQESEYRVSDIECVACLAGRGHGQCKGPEAGRCREKTLHIREEGWLGFGTAEARDSLAERPAVY